MLLDQAVADAHAIDAGSFRIKGYPYLRVNRFLASFREEVEDEAAFAAWLDRMQALDQDARKYEIANLPLTADVAGGSMDDKDEIYSKIRTCSNVLRIADFRDGKRRKTLRKKASAPSEYIWPRRVFGLYPLTRWFVSCGVSNWQTEAKNTFSTQSPVEWQSIRYAAGKSNALPSVRQIVESTRRDALGIPLYSTEDREALFRFYAPAWEIQTVTDHDRIGTPFWDENGQLDVNIDPPVIYTRLSFTRFEKEILTQLNYIVWFPARPKKGVFDLYGGVLDGVNYRMTLGIDGEPLLYETIHNCGCYYKAYPTRRLKAREKIDYAEPPLILRAPEITHSKELMNLAMESRTHYVQNLYPLDRESQSESVVYSLVDYDRLRSLPDTKGGHRSMFNENSIAFGSERLERFILWPTGVVSPGAMRQWGRHAVAFVGKRHFDDPFALEKMFRYDDSE